MPESNAQLLSSRDIELTRTVIHGVDLEEDPLDGLERVLAEVVHAGALDGSPDEYRKALMRALSSNVALARLGSEYHPEPILRRFLAELLRRLTVLN